MDLTIYWTSTLHLLFALIAGALIGIERTKHGRPAGLRTHMLVCMSSALLMLVTVFQLQILPALPLEVVRVDPTRMAQGIMTGIGFLGAGTILKEGVTVRGLTTAACIWVTASIGILFGLGFFFPAALATILTLATLITVRWFEKNITVLNYARLSITFDHEKEMEEGEIQKLLETINIKVSSGLTISSNKEKYLRCEMSIKTKEPRFRTVLAKILKHDKRVLKFHIVPISD